MSQYNPSYTGDGSFDPSYNAHVTTGEDAFYGDQLEDNWSPLTAFWNFITGHTQQQQLQSNQQEFDEYIYNKYNSPEALVRQYKKAGINTNLLGSTSFGTAQSAASAPSSNALDPLASLAGAAESIGSASSLFSDIGLKQSETDYYKSLPSLNKALEDKYGKEAQLTEQEWITAKQLYDWQLQDRECNAMTLRIGYFQAVQNYRNSMQEFENMVKEGKVLDEEKERLHWEAQLKQETFNMLVENHFLPDADFLDRIWIDYIQNGNSVGFNKFVNGQTMLWTNENREAARFGKYGNTVKIGGVEVPVEYLLQSGKDLVDVIKDFNDDSDKPTWVQRFFGLGKSHKSSSDSNSSESSWSPKQEKIFHEIDAILRAVEAENPEGGLNAHTITSILRKKGYSYRTIGEYLEYRNY